MEAIVTTKHDLSGLSVSRIQVRCRPKAMKRKSKLKNPNALRLCIIGTVFCVLTWGGANFIAELQSAYINVYAKDITRPMILRNEFGHRPNAWRWYLHEFIGYDPDFEDNDDYMDGK